MLRRLREDIISCVLKPGEKLRFETLRSLYGVSYSTLREALSRLSAEGLVVSEGQRGFFVAPITEEDLLDITDARVVLERECIRRSLENGNADWEAGIGVFVPTGTYSSVPPHERSSAQLASGISRGEYASGSSRSIVTDHDDLGKMINV